VSAIGRRAQSVAAVTSLPCVEAEQLTLAVGNRLIEGIDLGIPIGAHVALMGASGVGKTTLLETLAGLRDGATRGSLHLLGTPLSACSREEICQTVAYMGQRPYLFEGTLADNIRLGCEHADDGAVRAAAKRACVTDFSDAWPDGLHTRLGVRGQGLSGGQAHRVALARLYLRDPVLVLVDEPTAHLDDATAARVVDGLLAWCAGRTLIMATHSEQAARRCASRWRLDADGMRAI